jgi:hypothetical protein
MQSSAQRTAFVCTVPNIRAPRCPIICRQRQPWAPEASPHLRAAIRVGFPRAPNSPLLSRVARTLA